MVEFAQFLELSVPTEDIQASLEFYQRLGFTELVVNDIREHYYAVVTDGRIAIGLHADGFDVPTLSFVQKDIEKLVRSLSDAGQELVFAELGHDRFHEAGLCDPDGHPVRLSEARTFSRNSLNEAPATAIGRSAEITLRCNDYYAAFRFWELADFVTDDDPVASIDETDVVTIRAPGIVLGLRARERSSDPVLRFIQADIDATLDALGEKNIDYRHNHAQCIVTAPEGTRLILIPG
jgi:predicted lactoylglutathione lyase